MAENPDIYVGRNIKVEWLTNLFTRKTNSKDVAKDRLKLVLLHDRVNCGADSKILEMMKSDIIEAIQGVVSKYMDIDDADDLDVQISQTTGEGNTPVPVLYANIPIKNVKRRHK